MSRALNIFVVLFAIAGGFYQLYFKPIFVIFGHGRVVESIGNRGCITVPELQACEKIVLHQPTGVLYLACSTPASRTQWLPAMARLNATGASRNDYVATYDHKTSSITRLEVKNFNNPGGLSLHGMDVLSSSSSPSDLLVYLINHRAPKAGQPAYIVGADSVIEIFKTSVGGATLTHIQTIEDPIINTPNDVVGSSDGQSFYFTNDHGEKTGIMRELDIFGRATTSVGYCHTKEGCRYAIMGMYGNNGITRADNDTFYVGSSMRGTLNILERQSDNSLVLLDVVKTGRSIDNLSIDSNGVVWAAGIPDALKLVFKHFADPSIPAPSSALRLSINTGPASFYGEKYRVEKVFEDNGTVASGATSVAHDAERGLLFLHGIAAPYLTVCTI